MIIPLNFDVTNKIKLSKGMCCESNNRTTKTHSCKQFPPRCTHKIKLPYKTNKEYYSSSRIFSPLGLTTLPMYKMELVLLSFTRKMNG